MLLYHVKSTLKKNKQASNLTAKKNNDIKKKFSTNILERQKMATERFRQKN